MNFVTESIANDQKPTTALVSAMAADNQSFQSIGEEKERKEEEDEKEEKEKRMGMFLLFSYGLKFFFVGWACTIFSWICNIEF